MKISRAESRRRLEQFEKTCREAGFKLTHQRREIFLEVVRSGEHPDAETVFHAVRRRVASVSQDTVYRTLRMLADIGVINVLGASNERVRFDGNNETHHHFLCSKCGLTVDFESPDLDDLPVPEEIRSLGAIRNVQVEVRGICARCGGGKRSSKQGRKKEKC